MGCAEQEKGHDRAWQRWKQKNRHCQSQSVSASAFVYTVPHGTWDAPGARRGPKMGGGGRRRTHSAVAASACSAAFAALRFLGSPAEVSFLTGEPIARARAW